jgi:hypothetical protein
MASTRTQIGPATRPTVPSITVLILLAWVPAPRGLDARWDCHLLQRWGTIRICHALDNAAHFSVYGGDSGNQRPAGTRDRTRDRRKYPPLLSAWMLYIIVALLLVANIINIGADIGAMGAAVNLLAGDPTLLYSVLFAFVSVLLQVFVPYKTYSRS